MRPTFTICLAVIEGRLPAVTIILIGSLLPVKWLAQSKTASNGAGDRIQPQLCLMNGAKAIYI